MPATETNGYKVGDVIIDADPKSLVFAFDDADVLQDDRANLKPDPGLVNAIIAGTYKPLIRVNPRPNPKNPEKTDLVIVTGRRSNVAAIEAKRPVNLLVVSGTDTELLTTKLQENILRLELSPTQKSNEFARFITSYQSENEGASASDAKKALAELLNTTTRHINEMLELQRLSPKVQRAIDKGDVLYQQVTGRGKGLTNMLDEEGNPDKAKQEAALERLIPKPAASSVTSKPKRPNKNDLAPLSKRDEDKVIATNKVPKAVRIYVLFRRGEINLATACANVPWLLKAYQSINGPGWEPEGEVMDVEEILAADEE